MILSGFDLATRKSGYCVGDGLTLPACGAFLFEPFGTDENPDLGGLLDLWDRYLAAHIEAYRPDVAVYEKPILVINRKFKKWGRGDNGAPPLDDAGRTDKPGRLRKIYSMGAHLEFVCFRRGIECSEVTLQSIKREVTGNAQADKDAMVAVAQRVGLKLPATLAEGREDAADAWGAWLLALRQYQPAISREWDKRIWSRRRLV